MMMPIDDEPTPDDDKGWDELLYVQVLRCVPGRADNSKTGEPVAMLKLKWGEKRPPLMISLADARRLVVSLASVLGHFDDALAKHLLSLHFQDGEWPSPTAAPSARTSRRKGQRVVKPSISAQSPQKRIQETEVWQLIQMLRHVQSHDDFMQLIGVPSADIEASKPFRKRKQRPSR